MGGVDKALLDLNGAPMIGHVIARLTPQVTALALNANGDAERFAQFGLPVLPDETYGLGPLSGMLAGLRFAAREGFPRMLAAPCDTPFLPEDLAERLSAHPARAAYGTRHGRAHPTIALLDTDLGADLAACLDGGHRAVLAFFESVGAAAVAFDDCVGDPFLNVNTPIELSAAERAG